MPYNGSGLFQLIAGNPVVTGTVISSTWANNTLADVANNGLTNCITRDGQTTPTANLPMGAFQFTNLAPPAGDGQALRWEQLTKGADIASAATIAIPNEGMAFDVTGTTGVTALSGGFPGRYVFLRFTGVLTLTNSSSLVLPNGQNITTAANEIYGFICPDAGIWVCVVYPQKFYKGRLLGVRQITSTQTYTPTVGTMSVIVEMVGGGGAAGGAAATGAGTYSIGTAGKAASYGMGLYTSGFAGVTVTIGAAGAAVSGANGGNGGTSSFGSLLSVPGGGGGTMFGPTGSVVIAGNSGATPSPSGANLKSIQGAEPALSILQPGGLSLAAAGANSPLGNGGRQQASSADGVGGLGFGAGGGAALNLTSQPARPGGGGSPGSALIWEYS